MLMKLEQGIQMSHLLFDNATNFSVIYDTRFFSVAPITAWLCCCNLPHVAACIIYIDQITRKIQYQISNSISMVLIMIKS